MRPGNQGGGADGLFVYGSLRAGGSRHAWLKRTDPEGLCRAWTPGRLFQLPNGDAALVPGPDPGAPGPGWVLGDFVGYEDEEALDAALADLDTLEGVEEELYLRRAVPVLLDGGQRFVAWAYVFPEDRLPRLAREALELASGDWSPYLEGG
jgi:gamma-glutamylcyclotransferase (GGCT)/AIG2-like uncharacterized protein YtfP